MIRRVTLEFDTWQEAEGVCDRLVDAGYEPSLQCENADGPVDDNARIISCAVVGTKGFLKFAELIGLLK